MDLEAVLAVPSFGTGGSRYGPKVDRFMRHREAMLAHPGWMPEEEYNLDILTAVLSETWDAVEYASEFDSLRNAYRIAVSSHAGQKRKEEKFPSDHLIRPGEKFPYFKHPYEVALLLAYLGYSPKVCAVGLLHDVPEESPIEARGGIKEDIKDSCGPDVLEMVESLTESFSDMGIDKFLSKLLYMHKVTTDSYDHDLRIFPAKAADKFMTLLTLSGLKVESQHNQTIEVAHEVLPVIECLDGELAMALRTAMAPFVSKFPEARFRKERYSIYDQLLKYARSRNLGNAIDFLEKYALDHPVPTEGEIADIALRVLDSFPNASPAHIHSFASHMHDALRTSALDAVIDEYFISRASIEVDDKTTIRRAKKETRLGYERRENVTRRVSGIESAFTSDTIVLRIVQQEVQVPPLLPRRIRDRLIAMTSDGTQLEKAPYLHVMTTMPFKEFLNQLGEYLDTACTMILPMPHSPLTRVIVECAEGHIYKWRQRCRHAVDFPTSASDLLDALDPIYVSLYLDKEGRDMEEYFSEVSSKVGRTVIESDRDFQEFIGYFRKNQWNLRQYQERNPEYCRLRLQPGNHYRTHPQMPAYPFLVIDFEDLTKENKKE